MVDIVGTTNEQAYATGHKKKKIKKGYAKENSRTIVGNHVMPKNAKYGK